MRIGDRIRALFAPSKPEPAKPAENAPHQKDVGWSESTLLYSRAEWPKYNPDDLIGRKGAGIYKKMMQDEQVKAVVRFKRDAITSRDWYFECEHEELSEEEREKRIALFEHIVRQLKGSWIDSMNGILSGMYNGFSKTEKLYAHIELDGLTWVGIEALKLKPFDTFYFHVDEFGNIERIVQKWEGKEQDIDPAKFIHYVQNPEGDEHYGQSELREAYRAWFSKDMIIRFQNIYLERMAGGFVWAAPKDGKTLSSNSQEYTMLQSVLTNITTKTAIILPAGIDLHVEHPASTDAFERAIAQQDKAIAKALLVPNLLGISEQGQVGSYSQSETQLKAFLWTLKADSNRLADTLNEQLFRELGDLNFGDNLYPKLCFKPLTDQQLLEIIRLWKELVGAKAVRATDTDEAHLRELLDFPEAGEEIIKPEPVVPPGGAPGQDPNNPNPQDPNKPPQKEEPPKPEDEKKMSEETVVGRLGITVSAFKKAINRVDFAVIGSKADDASHDAAYDVAAANGDAVARMLEQAETLKLGTAEGNPDDVTKIKFTAEELSKMKAAVMGGLKDGWKIGQSHAQRELSKANKERFGRKYFESNDLALQDVASSYFKTKGHQITGDISAATQKQIQNALLEGIKTSKSFRQTKEAIYKALEADGLLTDEDVIEALGTKTVKNTKARIDTIMRTSTFEAINEARYQTFSAPDLADFVEALEYSAILDDRTTDICSQLNAQTFKTDDPVWSTYRPPNHFNCRSLLIPVTVRDTWTPGEQPTSAPQKGFGFHRCEGHK